MLSVVSGYLPENGESSEASSILHVEPVDHLRGSSLVLRGGSECYDPRTVVAAGEPRRTGPSRTSPVFTSLVVTTQTGTGRRGTSTAQHLRPPTVRPASPTGAPRGRTKAAPRPAT